MNAALTALNAALFLLSWEAREGITYSVQISDDLISWETLPALFRDSEGTASISFEAFSPAFARLRYSSTGDTNENGLPDHWEWQTFGFLDVDPSADPDEDGRTNLQEWEQGTDPLDFFNGQAPSLLSACGSVWYLPVDSISSQSLNFILLRPDGRPWSGAPVAIRLSSDRPGLLQAGDPAEAAVSALIAHTDSLGRVSPEFHAIRYRAPSEPTGLEVIHLEAGEAKASIRMHVLPGQPPGPPRDLRWHDNPDGSRSVSWWGSPDGARSFVLEKSSPGQTWRESFSLPVTHLPDPDPETGRYTVRFTP
ncbi:MAG: hypothetical protein R6V45_11795 [Oceanipulchritudo sp.]